MSRKRKPSNNTAKQTAVGSNPHLTDEVQAELDANTTREQQAKSEELYREGEADHHKANSDNPTMIPIEQRTNGHQMETHQDRPPTHREDPIVSINEAGRLIGVTWHTVASYVNGGILNYIRYPGGKIGVRMSEVNEILRLRNAVKDNKSQSATA